MKLFICRGMKNSVFNIYMGCWDEPCLVCGNPPHGNINQDIDQKYNKITNWMNKCTVLTASCHTIHGCKETACNVTFSDGKVKYQATPYETDDFNRCIFVHDDCYNYVKKNFKISLRYDMFKFMGLVGMNLDPLHFGAIGQYMSQDIMIDEMIKNRDDYLLYSPLIDNKKNRARINKIIRSYNLKKNRTGPIISASSADNNDIRIGNYNNFWIKKNGKWVKMADKLLTKKETKLSHNILSQMRQICEFNKIPLFLKVVSYKSPYIYEVIGTSKTLEALDEIKSKKLNYGQLKK